MVRAVKSIEKKVGKEWSWNQKMTLLLQLAIMTNIYITLCDDSATINSHHNFTFYSTSPANDAMIIIALLMLLLYTMCQKTKQISFCQNLGKFPLILIIFDM